MTKTKKTLGLAWTRYHNYYGMNAKLYPAMWREGWSEWAIKNYSIAHAYEVNHKMATRYKDNPPNLPAPDDKNWLKRHLVLQGSGKAPRKPILPKQTKRKGSSEGTKPKPHRYTSFPEWDYHGVAGSGRGIFGWSVQGYQPLCHPHKKGNYHAQGHPAGDVYPGRMYITPSSF